MHKNRLCSFLTKFKLISTSQYGFLGGVSTADARINLTEQIFNDLNGKNHILSIFVDLQKAFDTVNHLLLLTKLEKIFVRRVSLELFTSYLANRQQFIRLNDTNSSLKQISIGVPQGSILGPIFFHNI